MIATNGRNTSTDCRLVVVVFQAVFLQQESPSSIERIHEQWLFAVIQGLKDTADSFDRHNSSIEVNNELPVSHQTYIVIFVVFTLAELDIATDTVHTSKITPRMCCSHERSHGWR